MPWLGYIHRAFQLENDKDSKGHLGPGITLSFLRLMISSLGAVPVAELRSPTLPNQVAAGQ
jgi:hypothetical protein